jgi:hypothetical protein
MVNGGGIGKISRLITSIVLLALLAVTPQLYAEDIIDSTNKPFLTVETITEDGYRKLTGLQIIELMDKHVIEVVDIETEATSVSQLKSDSSKSESGMERKFDETKKDKASAFLDTRLLARAPPLDGKIERRVEGNALVATDAIRTYRYRVYEKQGHMYAVRDIDAGYVYYEVKVK